MRRLGVVLACVLLSATEGPARRSLVAGESGQTARADRPRLILLITVDQMRADYVERFKSDWTRGLKRLITEGAWFREAAFPYLTTVTCAGHATIATGAFPHVHGIIQNSWWDRESAALTTCTRDPAVRNIGYGVAERGGDSAVRLAAPTLADRLRERDGRVVSLSLKARSAIMSAGRGGTVTWASAAADGWVTSSAFAAAPVPEVQAFIEANPIDADFGKAWTRALPPTRYQGPDDGEAEAPPSGWTSTFPHVVKGKAAGPDAVSRTLWQTSPFADAYVGRFAAALAGSMQLGRRGSTDLLAVSFSSADLVGHAFGPGSHEVHDLFIRLDETIGVLLDRLDALVGKGQYTVALSADHGVSPMAEQARRGGREAGRLDASAIRAEIERHAEEALGDVPTVARVNSNDVYFQPGVYEKLAASGGLHRIVAAVTAMPGMAAVFKGEDVREGAASPDPRLRAAALGYFAGRSGDLIMVPKPGWGYGASGAKHGTAAPDDQRVPILLMGYGIRSGEYREAVTPADLAPTLALLAGVRWPSGDGRPLRSAITEAAWSAAGPTP
jgi:predicted AlkP superfamily pyrophosphatase or phosphodiesterase